MHSLVRLSLGCSAAIAALAGSMALPVQLSQAQTLPACQPPRSDEYLLIVLNPTEEIQTQLRNALPANATATVCTYLADTVLRVDGFNNADVADSWAQYVTESSDLRAFVARPPAATAPPAASVPPSAPAAVATPPNAPADAPAPTVTATPPAASDSDFPQPTSLAPSPVPAPAPSSPAIAPSVLAAPATTATPTATATPTPAYNPQPLGAGYAVLVDYANRPELAIELRDALTRDVGLVAYAQRPYLLAAYTPDLAAANTLLQTLSGRNFTALIVDGRSTILLTPVVAKAP